MAFGLCCTKLHSFYWRCLCNNGKICYISVFSKCVFLIKHRRRWKLARYLLSDLCNVIYGIYQNGVVQNKTNFQEITWNIYCQQNLSSESTINRIVEEFYRCDSVEYQRVEKYKRSSRLQGNIYLVGANVVEKPNMSVSSDSQQVGLSEITPWSILQNDLALKAYKVQIVQELKIIRNRVHLD